MKRLLTKNTNFGGVSSILYYKKFVLTNVGDLRFNLLESLENESINIGLIKIERESFLVNKKNNKFS